MQSNSEKQSENKKALIVNVAVAVIHYQDQYLLGFRSSAQHQGNRYEFVGGKIESNETAVGALIREVVEETGIDISDNVLVKLGRLHHDYIDKQVCLQVYKVALTAAQYEQHRHCRYGLEEQALTWVPQQALLAGDYPLPAANQTILAWLQLPTQIAITYPQAHFSADLDSEAAWLTYHQQHIPKNAWIYIRIKTKNSEQMTKKLMSMRPDIYTILPCNANDYDDTNHTLMKSVVLEPIRSEQHNEETKWSQQNDMSRQIKAFHLTHTELMQGFHASKDRDSKGQSKCSPLASLNSPLANFPLIVSCHDVDSIQAANRLAADRLQNQLPPVIAVFLSPVLATQTHTDAKPLGWKSWSSWAQLADMPVIGLGGLSPAMFEQAAQYGAVSIAGIRQFLLS
ncbi:NUDIX domain-containing protein [Psychrobacter sp. CAL346-MNA-CIBAN-0220]|uniref:NUDIX domain-containing protein n=1 Tax=Psychrobacter sp. CAL346-MNA-CIBAN-0220 TaxID=3140457 RepID=UPI003317035E